MIDPAGRCQAYETAHFDKIMVRLKKLSWAQPGALRPRVRHAEGLRQGIHGRHHQPARRARRRDRRRAHRLPA
mgnify:CR=1 FL=1